MDHATPVTPVDVLIVGAGPGGLAIAGQLRERDVEFDIIEKGTRSGEAWHNHYDRLHLHTVRELSHLPGSPFPATFPRYIPKALLAEYYETYARERAITPQFKTELVSLERTDGRWHAATLDGPTFSATHVVLATGVNRVPNRPTYPGQETYTGNLLHSRDYRRPQPFTGGQAIVVGMGNTGAEIALDLCEHGIPTALSVRGPVNAIPRDVLGRPTHLTARTLGKLPPWLAGPIGSALQKLTVGDLAKYGIEAPEIAPIEQLRRYGKTPVVDVGTIRRIKRGDIAVFPAIAQFDHDTVTFVDGRSLNPDTVILATGYRPQITDFLENCDSLLDHNGMPAQVVGEGPYRGLYFTGFDNYQPGGVLGTIFLESERIADAIVERTRKGGSDQ